MSDPIIMHCRLIRNPGRQSRFHCMINMRSKHMWNVRGVNWSLNMFSMLLFHIMPIHIILAAAHEPYLPENLSHHDGYRRHRVTLSEEMVPRDQIILYGSEHDMPQLSKERERDIALRSNYVAESYRRELPTAAASHVMLQPHSLAPSYERTLTYQRYYPVTTHPDQSLMYANPLQRPLHGTSYSAEADVPISTHYSYARAPSYR